MILSEQNIKDLERLGWDFLPYAPNEWQWMKFNNKGECIGFQCDSTWEADLELILRANEGP